MNGTVKATFMIDVMGKVTTVRQTGLKNTELEACIIKVIQAIEFPKPKGGGTVSVMCPLVFKKPK